MKVNVLNVVTEKWRKKLKKATKPAPATAPVATMVDPLAENHVARLGGELFGRHLVAVEAAGVLLLVALIGAVAVVSRGEAAHAAEATTATGPAAGRSAAR